MTVFLSANRTNLMPMTGLPLTAGQEIGMSMWRLLLSVLFQSEGRLNVVPDSAGLPSPLHPTLRRFRHIFNGGGNLLNGGGNLLNGGGNFPFDCRCDG
jgi:hypothetical protein